jgi:hypothetical protein
VLGRLGDDRFVRRIEIGKPPPITFQHTGYWGRSRPPADALWAYISAPAPNGARPPATDYELASWEVSLVTGALRDEFCAAGGRPLVGWSRGAHRIGLSDAAQPFNQRFANPTPAAIRRTLGELGSRYGFEVESLRLLRPLQLAPVVIV